MVGTGGDGHLGSYRLVVALGAPEYVDQLMRTAVDIARDREGEILVESVVLTARDSPLSVLTDDRIKASVGDERAEILDRALAAVGDAVPVSGEVRVGQDLSKAIVRAVRDNDADGLLLGWEERPRTDFVLGSNVDRVLRMAPCDVVVEKIGPRANGVDSVLLPTTGGPHAELAAGVARAIAVANDARIQVLHVRSPGSTDAERERSDEIVEAAADRVRPAAVDTAVVEGEDVAATIVARSRAHDVTVLGAAGKGWLRRLVVGSTPKRVGSRGHGTIIMTRRSLGVRSRVSRWLGGWW